MKPAVNRTATGPVEMMDVIAETIRSISARARSTTIAADSLLLDDLALDSLDLVAVILELQDHFQVEIDPDEITSLRSVSDLAASLTEHLRTAA
jgi:acyl carrier protein